MKSKDLIKILQELDPTGEEEVAVGNTDIYYVDIFPAYYDGRLNVLIRDDSKKPFYDVIGIKEVSSGNKISIRTLDLEDVVFDSWDDPDLIIEGSDDFKERAAKHKEEGRQTYINVYLGFFKKYIATRFPDFGVATDADYDQFFMDNLDTLFKHRIPTSEGKSSLDNTHLYWDGVVAMENGLLVIKEN